MIEIDSLSVRYGGRVALDGASFTAHAGRVTALLGPNGSGKSSVLKAVADLLPHQGRIERPPGATIGYLAQDNSAPATLTVIETVLLGRLRHLRIRVSEADLDAASAILTRVDAAHLADRWIREVSGGERQRVFLAQALAATPSILLLDEPTSALDLSHQLAVLELVRRVTLDSRLTTLVVLHDLNAAARYADDVVVLAGGRVAATGRPADVLSRRMIGEVFKVDAHIAAGPDGHVTVTPLRAIGGESL